MLKRGQSGFTIVELLIVIVVIGILAAITIVAFSGVQQRARNTATQQGLANYAKIFTLYTQADGNKYPGALQPYCIKDDKNNSSCGQVGSGAETCFDLGVVNRSTTVDTALAGAGSLPTVSSQTTDCGGQPYRGAFVYVFADGRNGDVFSFFSGNIPCPEVGGLRAHSGLGLPIRQQQGNTTLCIYALPAL